ncbi:TIGR03943 family protein [Bacillus sp. BGMRC 2118]|nr:TIGR03943 family protein [Bacillus sp. BGMRC 2118]
MRFHVQQALRALVLLVFCILIFKMHYTGEVTKYINPKYESLSQVASIIFLILFFIQTTRIWTVKDEHSHHCEDHSCSHDHGNTSFTMRKFVSYVIIIFPLVTGFLLPPKTLGADIASKKGGMAVISNKQQTTKEVQEEVEPETEDIQEYIPEHTQDDSLLDAPLNPNQETISKEEYDRLIQKLVNSQTVDLDEYVFYDYYEEMHKDINQYQGRSIKLKGFVYKEEGFTNNQLVISRFAITHCVADASIVGYLSEFPDASSLDEDTWIEAEGVIELTTYNDMELPMIKITKWSKVEQPKDPYIYPLSVKLL